MEAKRFLSLHQQSGSKSPRKQARQKAVKWTPPDQHSFKTNFDGALFSDTGEAGWGVVIRDHAGEIIAALSEKIPQPPLVTCLELFATRRVAIFVHEVGLQDSIMEGDLETVINSLRKGDMFQSAYGHLIRDTLSYVHYEIMQGKSLQHCLKKFHNHL